MAIRKPCGQCRVRLTTERFCDVCRGKLVVPKPCAMCHVTLTKQHYCDVCYAKKNANEREARPSARSRGYGERWRKLSKSFLKQHPVCTYCESDGTVKPATLVDHIIPHRGDPKLFWDESNWQPLCRHHHAVKTGRERAAIQRSNCGPT